MYIYYLQNISLETLQQVPHGSLLIKSTYETMVCTQIERKRVGVGGGGVGAKREEGEREKIKI